MPSSEPTTPKLSADDVLALSEAGLVQYMKRNYRPDSGFNLPVDGWEKLAKDKRDTLAERLRIGALKASDELQSLPVDLDQVNDRLFEILDKDTPTQAPSRPSRHQRSPTRSPNPRLAEEYELECYNDLVNEGGRPAYPVNLLDQVSQNPSEYRETLLPWQEYPDASKPDWKVFERQVDRWRDFRKWQKENREIYDRHSEYLAFTEETRRQYARTGFIEGLERLEAEPDHLKPVWYVMERRRLRDLWYLRENHGRGGFPEYVDEVNRRLAKCGFTRTFQLDEDPKRQDKLATWIEYLNYEYSWYDRYSRDVERLQPQHDEAWRKLVNSGVLRTQETEEYLRTTESSFRRQGEQDAARKAVESAKSAAGAVLISTQNEPQRSSLTKPVRLQMIRTAHARLDAANESLSATRKRGDLITNFIRGTFDYQTAQRNVKGQNIRLQWILEQVPRIAAEVNKFKAAEGGSNVGRGTKRRSGRDPDDEVTADRRPTKRNGQSLRSDGGTGLTTRTRGRSERSHRNDTVDDKPPSKRFRVDGRDSGFQRQTSGDVDATSTRGLQASGVRAARRQSGDGKAALKTSLAPSDRRLQPTDGPQLPLIGVESQSQTTKSGSDSRKWRKRGLEHDRDEIIKDRGLKRQRREAPDECGHNDTIDDKPPHKRHKAGRQLGRSHLQTPDEAETVTIGRSKEPNIPARSKDIGKQEGGHQAAAPLRRSARIAARQKPCGSPVMPSGSQEPSQWSRRKARQAQTPTSSTGSQDRRSRSQAKKTSKRILAGRMKQCID